VEIPYIHHGDPNFGAQGRDGGMWWSLLPRQGRVPNKGRSDMKKSNKTIVPRKAVAEVSKVSKIGKPIGEVGCCESRMAEQSH